MAQKRVVSHFTDSEFGHLRVIQDSNRNPRTGKPASRADAVRIAVTNEAKRIERRAKR